MEELKNYPVSLSEVVRSLSSVRQYVKPTQLLYYESLSKLVGASVHVKHENHNPTGTFKIRGGVNLMHHLKLNGVTGVITFSTGNNGISIATAAKWFGLKAVVVVLQMSGCNASPEEILKATGRDTFHKGQPG